MSLIAYFFFVHMYRLIRDICAQQVTHLRLAEDFSVELYIEGERNAQLEMKKYGGMFANFFVVHTKLVTKQGIKKHNSENRVVFSLLRVLIVMTMQIGKQTLTIP